MTSRVRKGHLLINMLGAVVCCAGIVVVLHYFCGFTHEFRGGYVPRLTFHKTVPDYDALERSRIARASTNAASSVALDGSVWNGFRGPRRDGHYDEGPVRTNWPAEGLAPVWRQPCGGGYASFAAAGSIAFTIEQRRDREVVAAYQIDTGRELWSQGWPAEFQEPLGGDGPRATPACDDGRVYALGALGEFRCLDAATGKLVWRKNILEKTKAHPLTYGMSASPLVFGSNVIVMAGGHPSNCVVACDKFSGKFAWGALDDGAAYSSPMLVTLAEREQLLIVTDHRAVGLDPAYGDLLWEHPWVVLQGNRNIAQPVILNSNRFLLSAGYGTGCAAVEIANNSGHLSARQVWRNKSLKNKFTSSVFWRGYVYGLDEDILTCLDAETGAQKWKAGRYGYGQLLLASGRLIILSGTGEIAIVRATDERWQELCRFAAIRGKTWDHPALVGGRLLVRNSAEMACYDLRPPK